uniref:Uncharacterized protein n=1 Tax=Fibrocapsa japonica TaxID=94617 RepID=A0A7S2XVT0_9STRA|mmetsp:Transcript_16716/g.24550  ORF Transcript_16716/g.24550 Transcript_16716/m.24550 type:complete len:105 (+) Transcript_16716:73-387(+)
MATANSGADGGKLVSLPLTHPMLSLAMLVRAGRPQQALQWVSAFEPALHGQLALFLESHGLVDQVLSCPFLTGLSPSLYHDLCLKHNKPDLAKSVKIYATKVSG